MAKRRHTSLQEYGRPWAKLVAQAWADADFKARLLADPAAFLKEVGVELPAGIELRVVENTAGLTHFVLPAPPPAVSLEACEERVSAGDCGNGGICCTTSCVSGRQWDVGGRSFERIRIGTCHIGASTGKSLCGF